VRIAGILFLGQILHDRFARVGIGAVAVRRGQEGPQVLGEVVVLLRPAAEHLFRQRARRPGLHQRVLDAMARIDDLFQLLLELFRAGQHCRHGSIIPWAA